MHQPVLLDADIDKGAESGDVRHDTRQYHALAQVVDRMHVGELENPGLAARIESGTGQLGKNVPQRRQPRPLRNVALQVYLSAKFRA